MDKTYTIKTIRELVEVYKETENKELLIKDLHRYVDMVAAFEGIAEVVGESGAVKSGDFNWIDDGKQDVTVNISVHHTNQEARE